MKKSLAYILPFLFTASILLSCNPTRTLTDNEFLVNKNIIKTDNKKISKDDIYGYIKQKSNRRIFIFFRFHLGVYNYASIGKKISKTDSFLLSAIAEPPVILDTLLTDKSVKQIRLYLNSKGYFNSDVRKEIKYIRKKRANIKYIIKAAQPYITDTLKYSVQDEAIRSIIYGDSANSLIKKGFNYDADVLQSERERITINLKNEGYYFFSKEFISYNVDSALGKHRLQVTMVISNPMVKSTANPDSLVPARHRNYTINDIDIYPDYLSLETNDENYKKYMYFAAQRKKTSKPAIYNFFYKDTLRIKPKTITQAVFFKQGDYYRLKDVEQTYSSLMDLKMFKFVNVRFSEAVKDSTINKDILNCKIQLIRTPVQSFSSEAEATNSAGNLGVAGNIVYQNKNIFRGAEIFKFKIRGAMEIQKVLGEKSKDDAIGKVNPFNTIEGGADASIDFPKLLLPVKQERFPKRYRPKTTINAGINYQKRPDYTRYIINSSHSFSTIGTKTLKHIFTIPEISSIKIYPTDTFASIIAAINDQRIKNSYRDHLTMSAKYSLIFNDQEVNKNKSFSYLQLNLEMSGLIPRTIKWMSLNFKTYDTSYTIFNIKYSQYFRGNLDVRRYFLFNKTNTIVTRITAGYGIAYRNSKTLPFEKSFFSGGANSNRAWRIYSLGPGSYYDEYALNLDKTGDINIEGNFEYRFPVYGVFKGALFVDAGNIWLNKKNSNMPEAEFNFNRFYKEFAIGSGLGARFDFSYFIIRFDTAVPVRDPAKPQNERWVLDDFKKERIQFNLGIGYPF